tara:strand:+ start:12143 stop:12340 length:198 start_codon:yes stop_codon:yes gene_type:complete
LCRDADKEAARKERVRLEELEKLHFAIAHMDAIRRAFLDRKPGKEHCPDCGSYMGDAVYATKVAR